MSDYPIQACQQVTYSADHPWTETDEFGVTIVVGPEKWQAEKQCATAPTEEAATKALRDVIDGFCAAHRKCHASSAVAMRERIPLGTRILRFLGEVLKTSGDNLSEYRRITGQSIWSGPKW